MRGPDPFLPGSEGLEAEGLEVKTIWVGIKNRESRGLLESEEGGGVGQKAHPLKRDTLFPLFTNNNTQRNKGLGICTPDWLCDLGWVTHSFKAA